MRPYFNLTGGNHAYTYTDGFIHPSVRLGNNTILGMNVIIEEGVEIGDDCFFGHNCIVRPNTRIGSNVEVRAGAWVANDCNISDRVAIFNNAIVAAQSIVGSDVYYGPGTVMANVNKITKWRGEDPKVLPVWIKSGARIASNVTLLAGIVVHRNALVGAGSVVTKDVPKNEIWVGNPAKKMGRVDPLDVPELWRTDPA